MREIRETDQYSRWFSRLRDREARARILIRIRRLSLGNPGDCSSVGGGVMEMRIHHGPGYRVYFVERGPLVVILVAGGSKATQRRDIQRAKELAQEV
jgi:putative addiction module killer protein